MNDAVCGQKSRELFEEAKTLLPGGVSSPVRAIAPYPFYTASGNGCRLKTVDGAEYIDCCLGYGPLLLGHGEGRTGIEVPAAGLGAHTAVGIATGIEIGKQATTAVGNAHRAVNEGLQLQIVGDLLADGTDLV